MGNFDDYINVTAPLHSATTKGKLGNANEIFIENDEDNIQNVVNKTNEHLKKLDNRSSQMEESIKNISVTGGASVAEAVTYDNTASGLEAVNVKGAVDELQSSKIDKSSILQESGEAEDKVMSQKAVSDKLSDLSLTLNKQLEFTGYVEPTVKTVKLNVPPKVLVVLKFWGEKHSIINIDIQANDNSSYDFYAIKTFDENNSYENALVKELDYNFNTKGIKKISFKIAYGPNNVNYEIKTYPLDGIILQNQIEINNKFNKENIVQESGDAEDKVISQKAVSTKFSDLDTCLFPITLNEGTTNTGSIDVFVQIGKKTDTIIEFNTLHEGGSTVIFRISFNDGTFYDGSFWLDKSYSFEIDETLNLTGIKRVAFSTTPVITDDINYTIKTISLIDKVHSLYLKTKRYIPFIINKESDDISITAIKDLHIYVKENVFDGDAKLILLGYSKSNNMLNFFVKDNNGEHYFYLSNEDAIGIKRYVYYNENIIIDITADWDLVRGGRNPNVNLFLNEYNISNLRIENEKFRFSGTSLNDFSIFNAIKKFNLYVNEDKFDINGDFKISFLGYTDNNHLNNLFITYNGKEFYNYESKNKYDSLKDIHIQNDDFIIDAEIDYSMFKHGPCELKIINISGTINDYVNSSLNRIIKYKRFPILKRKLAAWVDDDCIEKDIPKVKNICDEKGIKCSFAANGTPSGTLLTLLRSYQAEGFDIVSHSYTHGHFWYNYVDTDGINHYDINKIREDIQNTYRALNELGFCPKVLVYPGGGGATEETRISVSRYFDFGIQSGHFTPTDFYMKGKYRIDRYFMETDATDDNFDSDLNAFKNYVQQCAEVQHPVILGSHSATASWSKWNTNFVKACVQYLLDEGYTFMTATELCEALKPAYDFVSIYTETF